MSRAVTILIVSVFAVLVLRFACIPVGWETNCGGNSEALSNVHNYVLAARMGLECSADHSFRITEVDPVDRSYLALIGRRATRRGVHYLVSTAPITDADIAQRRIIIVCDKPYNNVPRQRFFAAPYTHAAGYADGSFGLLTVEQFAALDRSSFVSLDQLFPEDPEQPPR